MAEDKTNTTSPPTTANITEGSSSPATPIARRARMTSPAKDEAPSSPAQPERKTDTTTTASATSATGDTAGIDEHEDVDDLEAGDADLLDGRDSALGTDNSETTSIASSIYAGHVENGRRYQTVREGEYWGPSDEKQFEAMETVHMCHLILDCKRENPLFFSPIPKAAQNILDLGTGSGIWAKDVADRYPSALVQGVDLYPPPETWVPPNCRFEVDDVLKPWPWTKKFDLIHMRTLMGAFTDEQWRILYKQAYTNILHGGYIEQVEWTATHDSDDGTLPPDSGFAKWGHLFITASAKSGKRLDTIDTFKSSIEAAGFVDVQEKVYKLPFGEWTRDPILREAGKFNKMHFQTAMEGYALYLLTKYGDPEPWSPDEVQVLLTKVRNDMNNMNYHAYSTVRRVWARKPWSSEASAKPEVEVENVA